jgi:hypothetical protein
MAQIPTVTGRSIPQPVASVPRYDATISGRGYAQSAAITERMGENLAANLDRTSRNLKSISDQQDETAYQAAKANFLSQKIEADTAFEQDPDYQTAPTRYRDTVGKLASEAGAGITNPALKQRFIAETGYFAAQGVAGLKKAGHAKSVAARVDWLTESLKTNSTAALAAKDEPTRAGILQSTMGMIDSEVKSGLVSPGEGARLKREWATNYAKDSIGLLPATEQLAALLPKAPQAKPGAIEQAALLPPDTEAAIDRNAPSKADADILKQFVAIESGGNAGAVNPKSGAAGLLQLMPATAAQYGVTDPLDINQNVKGAAGLLADNRKVLRGALGREPTVPELYLAHQQGATGASALLANPDKPAVSVLTAVYGDPEIATKAIVDNGGSAEMTAGQFASLWMARVGDRAGAAVADAMAGTPAGGWDFTQKTGTAADFIPADERAKMIENAQTAIKQEQTDARIKVQTGVEVAFDDQKQNAFLTGEADKAFKAQIMAAYPDARGLGKIREIDRMAEMGQVNKQFKVNGAVEDQAYMAGLAEQAAQPGPGSAEAAVKLADAQKLYEAKQTALEKDPSLWAQQNSPTVADSFDQWASAEQEEQAAAFSVYAATTIAEQERQGVADPKILPADIAAKLGESFNPKPGQSSEEAVQNIRQMEAGFGGYANQVFDQVAGKMSDAALTVAVMSPSQDLAAARLIEANQNKEKLEKATDGTVGTAIKDAVAAEFGEFAGTFLHDTAGAAEALKYIGQAELLARSYVFGGMEAASAAERARKEIIDPIYDTSIGVRVPVRFDAGTIERGAGSVADDLGARGLDPVGDDMGAGDAAQQQYLRSIQANHTWVNSPDGQGLVMLDELNRPVLKNGKPFQVNFDELQEIGSEVPAEPMKGGSAQGLGGGYVMPEDPTKPVNPPPSRSGTKGRSRRGPARGATEPPAQGDFDQGGVDSMQALARTFAAKPVNERTPEEQDFLNRVREQFGYDPARETSTKGGDAAYPPNHRPMNP